MTTALRQAWYAISPTPVFKGDLIQPEATDTIEPSPWMRLPPGAVAMFGAIAFATIAASLQVGVDLVRREGLPIDLPIPAFEALKPAPPVAGRTHARRRPAKLHHLLQPSPLDAQAPATLPN
jgi:hypothetical protein